MEIVPGLHLVDGMESTPVMAYVWERPDGGLTLIDAGMPDAAPLILNFLEGMGLERLDRIIITHGDIDHMGGLATIKAKTGARVLCHAVEKDLLAGRRQRRPAPSLLGRLLLPLYLLVTRFFLRAQPVEADELLLDRQMLPEGLQVVHVPGHTDGQIALFQPQRGILIAADALSNRGNKLSCPPALFTPHMKVAQESVRKLARLQDVRVICVGHGPPITENAGSRLQALADSLP